MTHHYRGPELPVYNITLTIPRVPITDGSVPTPQARAPPPAARAPTAAYQKPSPAIRSAQLFYDKYIQMCEGIEYLEAKKQGRLTEESGSD